MSFPYISRFPLSSSFPPISSLYVLSRPLLSIHIHSRLYLSYIVYVPLPLSHGYPLYTLQVASLSPHSIVYVPSSFVLSSLPPRRPLSIVLSLPRPLTRLPGTSPLVLYSYPPFTPARFPSTSLRSYFPLRVSSLLVRFHSSLLPADLILLRPPPPLTSAIVFLTSNRLDSLVPCPLSIYTLFHSSTELSSLSLLLLPDVLSYIVPSLPCLSSLTILPSRRPLIIVPSTSADPYSRTTPALPVVFSRPPTSTHPASSLSSYSSFPPATIVITFYQYSTLRRSCAGCALCSFAVPFRLVLRRPLLMLCPIVLLHSPSSFHADYPHLYRPDPLHAVLSHRPSLPYVSKYIPVYCPLSSFPFPCIPILSSSSPSRFPLFIDPSPSY
ncbi:hypothetical protein C7M84_008878 [Penaeus vannamei]|uniref:Uncharacterized protein n=1 Tax=Penaeus vannamei TaxID=6689 RepID=A0A3R7PP33_PENVA|nr:hypothetical protein C7M84_008878 [Penaeus vannamei]